MQENVIENKEKIGEEEIMEEIKEEIKDLKAEGKEVKPEYKPKKKGYRKNASPVKKQGFLKAQIYNKNIAEETIFQVEVTGAKRDEEYGDVMLFTLNNTNGMVPLDEADDDIHWKSLISFIGREIPIVIKSYDEKNDRLICSRKEAQRIIKSKIVSTLSMEDEIVAKVSKLTYFGAYVEIHGVTGILKNENFSDDHISVGDVFKVGDTLKVKLLRVNNTGKLAFKVPKMFKKSSMSELSNFEVDQVIKGSVIAVKDWGFYVRLLPGVDALCPLPRDEEVFVGSNAVIKLTQIFDEKGNLRIRGRLIKFLAF